MCQSCARSTRGAPPPNILLCAARTRNSPGEQEHRDGSKGAEKTRAPAAQARGAATSARIRNEGAPRNARSQQRGAGRFASPPTADRRNRAHALAHLDTPKKRAPRKVHLPRGREARPLHHFTTPPPHLASWPNGYCIGVQSRGFQVRVLVRSLFLDPSPKK